MNLSKATIQIFLVNILDTIIGFIAISLFSRLIGVSGLGSFFIFQATLHILSIFSDMGLGKSISKRMSEGKDVGDYLFTGLLIQFPPIVFLCGGILIFEAQLNSYLGSKVALLLIPALIVRQYNNFSIHAIEGELKVGQTAILQIAQQTTWLLLGAVLIFLGGGIKSLIYSYIFGHFVSLMWASRRISTELGEFSKNKAYSLLAFSKFMFISSLGGQSYNWVDVLVMGWFLSDVSIGAYELAWRVSALSLIMSKSVSRVIFPQISAWSAENNVRKIEDLFPLAVSAVLIISIPSLFGIILFSKEVLSLLFTSEAKIASLALIVLMSEKVIHAFHGIVGQSLHGLNKPNLVAKATIISVITNVVLNIILIPKIGILGAALATTISHAINTIIISYLLRDLIEMKISWKHIGWYLLSSVAMCICLIILKDLLFDGSVISLFLLVSIGTGSYLGVLILWKPLREQFRQITVSYLIG